MRHAETIDQLEQKAHEVSGTLRLLANEKRLLVLCQLVQHGEMSVSALGEAVRLGQSALSQHLAKLRREGLVAARRESQMHYYRIADRQVGRLLEALYDIYCAAPQQEPNE